VSSIHRCDFKRQSLMFFPWVLDIFSQFGGCPSLRPHGGATCLKRTLQWMWSIIHYGGGIQSLVGTWQLGFLFEGLEMSQGRFGRDT
jgi:hypothetical protein